VGAASRSFLVNQAIILSFDLTAPDKRYSSSVWRGVETHRNGALPPAKSSADKPPTATSTSNSTNHTQATTTTIACHHPLVIVAEHCHSGSHYWLLELFAGAGVVEHGDEMVGTAIGQRFNPSTWRFEPHFVYLLLPGKLY
jgi:hypothetical protein